MRCFVNLKGSFATKIKVSFVTGFKLLAPLTNSDSKYSDSLDFRRLMVPLKGVPVALVWRWWGVMCPASHSCSVLGCIKAKSWFIFIGDLCVLMFTVGMFERVEFYISSIEWVKISPSQFLNFFASGKLNYPCVTLPLASFLIGAGTDFLTPAYSSGFSFLPKNFSLILLASFSLAISSLRISSSKRFRWNSYLSLNFSVLSSSKGIKLLVFFLKNFFWSLSMNYLK